MTTIGIVGGSGLYALDGLTNVRELDIDTPFGRPSDRLVTGELGGTKLVFLPRHGRGHRLSPTEVPYRANIFALKSLGVEWLLSVSAVGSMKEDIKPGDFVLADQYIDRTVRRDPTFFEKGVIAHVALADPTCDTLRHALAEVIRGAGIRCHDHGTYVCIEGPAFSTRAESKLYRSWGVDVIGMTAMPEARLAREAELHYSTIALATDYDCWHETEDEVSTEAVLKILQQNTQNVKRVLTAAVPAVARLATGQCPCAKALSGAVITQRETLPRDRLADLQPILGKYF
jgi:5'-methylthioadenosine phosphorylase